MVIVQYKAKRFRFVFRISSNHLHKLVLKCFLLYRTFEVDWHTRDGRSTYYNGSLTKTRRLTWIHYNDDKNYSDLVMFYTKKTIVKILLKNK